MTQFDPSCRKLLRATTVAAGSAITAAQLARDAQAAPSAQLTAPTVAAAPATHHLWLRANGAEPEVMIDRSMTLPDALRERLHPTGGLCRRRHPLRFTPPDAG